MQYSKPLIVDYGPKFLGHSFLVDERIVCVVPSQTSSAASAALKEMVRELGGNCGACRNCPLGQRG
ncbi:hypothetical protein [Streptomyces sp. NPDC057557]|uniref:hypothetical protein n=1 Tax=Streptomyces sp. NPDC057557 TaxID=3346167 RepID=UPI0036849448